MTDHSELKRLADEAVVFAGLNGEISYAQELFQSAANPTAVLALLADVEALRSQVAALQSDPNSWQSGYDEGRSIGTKTALDERGQLKAEVEALRKDAERYRFLKSRTQQADIELAVCLHDKRTQATVFLDGEYVDSQTDIAMNQEVKP